MKATQFEIRHPALLHFLIAGAAFSIYVVDPDDVVWRFIRRSPSARLVEHELFCAATLLIGAGAILSTSAYAQPADPNVRESITQLRAGFFGEWLYALGLAFLAPLWGFIWLVAAESVRLLRLAAREDQVLNHAQRRPPLLSEQGPDLQKPQWVGAFRLQAVKWGVSITMIAFTLTLIDRVADYGVAGSVAIWAILNLFPRRRQA